MAEGSSPAETTPENAGASEVSATETGTTQATENAGTDAKSPAESSPAPDANQPKTMLEAVNAALGKPAANGESSTPEGQEGAKPKAEAEGTEGEKPKGDAKDEEVPFHNHPRWKEVLRERDEARAEIEQFRGDAEEHRKITGFMDQAGLSPDEVADGFVVMSMLKNDPGKALERLEPIVSQLRRALGHELPDDLREKVDQGYVDEETAKETARLRGQSALTAAREEERGQREARTRAEGEARQAAASFAEAVSQWERGVQGADPDYSKKQGAVLRYAKAIIADKGRPATREDAVAIVKEAYELVNQDFRAALPTPAATPKRPQSGHSAVSTSPKPQPKTMAEAVRFAAQAG